MRDEHRALVADNLPEFPPTPTIHLHRDQLESFRDSFKGALAFIEAVTGLERPSVWSLMEWAKDTYRFDSTEGERILAWYREWVDRW